MLQMPTKKQEVSQLNRLHVDTIKILTTPTKNNCSPRLPPLSSPEHLNGREEDVDDIRSEQLPDMADSETACEALTEELQLLQEQANRVQGQLDEEQLKNRKLSQQMAKLEEDVVMMSQEADRKDELLSTERDGRNTEKVILQETINKLEKTLQSHEQTEEVMRMEIRDLQLVLQSSDKELAVAKRELSECRSEQEREASQLSSLISTKLQLDTVQLEWEQLLEEHRTLQDSFDQLQAEAKFEADEARQQLEDRQRELAAQQELITELRNSLQAERENASHLTAQSSRELIETAEENKLLRKQASVLTMQILTQTSSLTTTELNLAAANENINRLQQTIDQDKDVALDLINQTRDLRSELSQKDQNLALLSGDINEITCKFNAACSEREELKERYTMLQEQVEGMREDADRKVASNQVELEVLQDDLLYATGDVERLTKALDEQSGLLQASQDQTAQKDTLIKNLQQKLKQQEEAIEKTIRYGSSAPVLEPSCTPTSSPRTPCTPRSLNTNLTQVLESHERELESRRSSMMTMEILLAELNAERTAKNEEISRLKTQLSEKEIVRLEIQGLLDKFYTTQNQTDKKESTNGEMLNEAIRQSMLRELQEERAQKVQVMQRFAEVQNSMQAKETMLAQSQTCVQELTNELRNRCLELRELSLKEQDHDKVFQEVEVLRKQVDHLSEENGKLVGHKNHKQRIEYMVKIKKENSRLLEENEKLRSEMSLLRVV